MIWGEREKVFRDFKRLNLQSDYAHAKKILQLENFLESQKGNFCQRGSKLRAQPKLGPTQ